ncbi:MAG: 2,3-diaminopropionate biosynthesis protein SbnB [Acidobacteriota bacterium]
MVDHPRTDGSAELNVAEGGEPLRILGAGDVLAVLDGHEDLVLEAVADAYKAHADGHSSLPHSIFLRFPDSPRDRIIGLPAYLGAPFESAGMKWIASVPGNVERGLDRASAAVILNRRSTGQPVAMIEGSIISARRTAASAALAARELYAGQPERVALVGCGVIQLEILRFLRAVWPQGLTVKPFDLSADHAEQFRRRVQEIWPDVVVEEPAPAEPSALPGLLASSPLVSFATTAIDPHLSDLSSCPPGAVLLHISLRDLTAEAVLSADNVVDDLDHVNRAATSVHLASQQVGHTRFVRAEIGDVLHGRAPAKKDPSAVTVYSPFGLGVLDLALAQRVFESARQSGRGTVVEGFLPQPWRRDGGS